MITGYLRSIPLSVNSLIHIRGMGDFQMSQIDAPEDPYPIETKIKKHCNAMDDEPPIRILERADPKKQVIKSIKMKLFLFYMNQLTTDVLCIFKNPSKMKIYLILCVSSSLWETGMRWLIVIYDLLCSEVLG
ncbi:Pre-rRNA-processing protein TSR1 homolog [Anthophora plagiata]